MPRNSPTVPTVVPRTAPSLVLTTGPVPLLAVPAWAAVAPAVRVSPASAAQQAAASRARRWGAECAIIAAPSVEGKGLVSRSPAQGTGRPSDDHRSAHVG